MILVRMATYQESIGENTIDLIFAILLFLESLIYCKITEHFKHESDHISILFE